MSRVLHLTLKRQWFDLIHLGVKRAEYREIKPYWTTRLKGKQYDAVHFRNGYNANSPAMTFELLGIDVGMGFVPWGAPSDVPVYILRLGKMLVGPFDIDQKDSA